MSKSSSEIAEEAIKSIFDDDSIARDNKIFYIGEIATFCETLLRRLDDSRQSQFESEADIRADERRKIEEEIKAEGYFR